MVICTNAPARSFWLARTRNASSDNARYAAIALSLPAIAAIALISLTTDCRFAASQRAVFGNAASDTVIGGRFPFARSARNTDSSSAR